jgi:hypothetical protein
MRHGHTGCVGREASPPGSARRCAGFQVFQRLDDYESRRRLAGVEAAASYVSAEPALTGHSGVDAALAALTCWLADRDDWQPPAWATSDAGRTAVVVRV